MTRCVLYIYNLATLVCFARVCYIATRQTIHTCVDTGKPILCGRYAVM